MRFESLWCFYSVTQRAEIAAAAGSTVAYLRQVANGHARPSTDFVARLERATGYRFDDLSGQKEGSDHAPSHDESSPPESSPPG